DPLRRTDCSPVSDGAAALVLSAGSAPHATAGGAVSVAGVGHATDYFPAAKRDPLAFAASATAWQRAMDMAGVGVADLSFVEVHDCFTIAELVLYETFGLAPAGKGSTLLDDGTVYRDGRLPVSEHVRRAEVQRPSGRRHRREPARAGGHAADRQR